MARANAARQQNYLIDFAPPAEPQKPTVYFPIVTTATVFLGSLLLMRVSSLMVGAFRDQAGI